MRDVPAVIVPQLVHPDHFIVVIRIVHADPDPIALITFHILVDREHGLLGVLHIAEYIRSIERRLRRWLQVLFTGIDHKRRPRNKDDRR